MRNMHGLSKTRENRIWRGIKDRCYNPNRPEYKLYGGRGVVMCDEWKNDFTAFYRDMGVRPTPQHSVERIDTNGNYEPSNCRWATRVEQQNNMRKNVHVEYKGEVLTLGQLWRRTEVCRSTFYSWHFHGNLLDRVPGVKYV
jgi:hypothetical protein